MAIKDYSSWDKDRLIEEVKRLSARKKYGLVWEDKPEDVVERCKMELPVLDEVEERAIDSDPSLPTNFIIEGDNYHALSVLNYTHAGKVDVIYIDPPYNTGKENDFKYNDCWVDNEDSYKHSKWLSFINKRLRLAKQILAKDGVVFISIDDNENYNLRALCNEIFGEENALAVLNIQVRFADKSLNEEKAFKPLIENVLIYAQDVRLFEPNRPTEEYTSDKFIYEIQELESGSDVEINGHKVTVFKKGQWRLIKHEEGSQNGLKETWISGSIYTTMSYGKVFQSVVEPRLQLDGLGSLYKVHGRGEDGLGFRYYTAPQRVGATRGKMYSGMPLSRVEEMKTEQGAIRYAPIPNFYDFSADFGNIRHEGGVGFNSGKKPVKLLKFLLNLHKNKNITVLDFFAGSGSTGHAVLEANRDDGGRRSFLLCTNNENGIAEEVTHPRIKNVVKGYSGYEGIPANVRYFKTAFVPRSDVSDDTRRSLISKSTEILCVKESTFTKVFDNKKFKIYRNQKQTTAILFDLDAIEEFKERLDTTGLPTSIYVFSLTSDNFSEDFDDLKIKHRIRPIPEGILEVYRKIFA